MEEIRIHLPELHGGQEQIKREARRFNVLECGRRFGKSTFGLNLDIETALAGDPAAWFAPTYKYLTPIWHEAVTMLSPIASPNSQEKAIRLITGGVLDFWSLEDPDAGRGRKYKRVVVDEAGVVRNLQQAWQGAIRPTLTDLRGDAWFLGTPKGRNFFHQLFAKGESADEDWKAWRRGTVDNPYMDAAEIEAARRELPQQVFEQEYLGIPADDGGNPFGAGAIAACVGPISTATPMVFGWDLAKSVDWVVGVGLDVDGAVCAFERWQSSWEATKARIRTTTGHTWAIVDSTGVGDPVLEDLQRGASNFEGYKFTGPSKQQLMEGLAVAIQQREIRFPDGVLRQELDSFEYEYTKTGVRYSAPEGLHDDCVCALALAVHGWRQRSGIYTPPIGLSQQSYWRS